MINTEEEILKTILKIKFLGEDAQDLINIKESKNIEPNDTEINIVCLMEDVKDMLINYKKVVQCTKKTRDYKEFLTMILKEGD